MGFAEDDYVIEASPTDRDDQSLGKFCQGGRGAVG
jgi:hypothetical protein